MKSYRLYVLIILLLSGITSISQNSQAELEAKRKKLESEIAYTNKLLNETQTDKNSTVNQLLLIDVKVNKRTDLIATLKAEVYHLNSKIDATELSLKKLDEEIVSLKQKYAKIAWHAFKYSTAYNKLVFLFSADDINQAYQRMRYLDQLSSYIRTESEIIKKTENEKNEILQQLKLERAKKNSLLGNEQVEVRELEREQAQKNRIKNDLQSKERHLRKSIKDKEKQTKNLDRQIQNIILAETAPKKDASTGKTYELTPSEIKLTSSFASNKGKLPWPTERGVISETFGVHNHPVLKKVKTKNNGINILTSKNSEARAVFSGKVVSITTISNTNIAVIVKHGEYFTVYSNLDKVFVSRGDEIETKEIIGRIHTNLKGKTELHFEIWKGSSIQNPSYWVQKK
ncbi:MAG: peptidoglycan DD-metalloendopeptidase family protein [Bacteroidetes bacterium]|nr:peptidoglycan DD-metalloendopeptidase family protein [Bacteroidota bacterium]